MLEQKKCVDVPADPSREFVGFGCSIVQRILHNRLVVKLELARERLENSDTTEDMKFHQGRVVAFREALMDCLHLNDNVDTRKFFGYE